MESGSAEAAVAEASDAQSHVSGSQSSLHSLFSSRGQIFGIIAGSGRFPLDIARRAQELGHKVVVVAHRMETSEEIAAIADRLQWVKVGQLGAIIRFFKHEGVQHFVMAGGISRVRLFGGVRLDLAGIRLIARLGTSRDDVLLRGVAQELEKEGFLLVSAGLLLERAIPEVGVLTRRGLNSAEAGDAHVGWRVAHQIGLLDIGQTVVVYQGLVVAVEAVEGTDAAIRRAGELTSASRASGLKALFRGKQVGVGPVVVKCCKPQQDLRLDLPTVGEHTIRSMVEAGSSALVIEAGKTLLLDPESVVRAADSAGIAIVAVESADEFRNPH